MKIRQLELTLFLVLAVLTAYCAGTALWQRSMADDIVRLRVVAADDDFLSQSKKLIVRDAVLELCHTLIQEAEDASEIQYVLIQNLDILTQAIREVVGDEMFCVRLVKCSYPTRTYRHFSLPAGRYVGLQIQLGAAQGKNWWCVLYPALCTNIADSVDRQYDSTTFSFKSIEWLSAFCEQLWS